MKCFKTVLIGILFTAIMFAVIFGSAVLWAVVCACTGWLFGVEPNSVAGTGIAIAWGIIFVGSFIGFIECHG